MVVKSKDFFIRHKKAYLDFLFLTMLLLDSSCGIQTKKLPTDNLRMEMKDNKLKVIGWREWVRLPSLGIDLIKVKVDTGARTSSLHAYDMEYYKREGREYVKFKVHPSQENSKKIISCRSRILEYRKVKSSNGQSELRPVILTDIELLGERWPIEITLTNRDEMGFKMLLGRASFRNKFLVNPGRSFYSKIETEKINKKGK